MSSKILFYRTNDSIVFFSFNKSLLAFIQIFCFLFLQDQSPRKINADFMALFGRTDPLEKLTKYSPDLFSSSVKVERIVNRSKKGARIVKAIKPHGRIREVFFVFFLFDYFDLIIFSYI